jgi:hypothetical protein
MGDLVFSSTQFSPVEEQEKFRDPEGGWFRLHQRRGGSLLDQVIGEAQAGKGTVDLGRCMAPSAPAEDWRVDQPGRPGRGPLRGRELTQPSWRQVLLGSEDYSTIFRGCRPPTSWRIKTPSNTCRRRDINADLGTIRRMVQGDLRRDRQTALRILWGRARPLPSFSAGLYVALVHRRHGHQVPER